MTFACKLLSDDKAFLVVAKSKKEAETIAVEKARENKDILHWVEEIDISDFSSQVKQHYESLANTARQLQTQIDKLEAFATTADWSRV